MCSLITGLLISFVLVLLARLCLHLFWKFFLLSIALVLWLVLKAMNLIAWPLDRLFPQPPEGGS